MRMLQHSQAHMFDTRPGPGGRAPSLKPHSESDRPYDSPSPTLSSSLERHHSGSDSASTSVRTPLPDDHEPILPHTQAYHHALRNASGSHSPYSTFPSFIAVGPPQQSLRQKRSHSPVRAAQPKRTLPSHSKPKSRSASPAKPRSRPGSPIKTRTRTSPINNSIPPAPHRERARSCTLSQQQAAATASRSRPTTPSTSTFGAGAGRTRIPQRPRAYSASAAEVETLTDTSPPPLPHFYSPRQAFPGAPTAHDMSVTTRAPEAIGLPGNVSGIPILKSRTRSSPRSPSPEFPDGAERLADELPPFRVDLDAALAEIEDEIEVRAHERYVSALPAPRTPNSATFATVTPGSTPPSSIGSASVIAGVSKIPPPKQRPRPSLPNSMANGTDVAAASAATPRHGTKRRAGSVPLNHHAVTPKTKDGLGRAASYSTSPDGRSKSMPRRRHGSDTAHLAAAVVVPPRRPTPTLSTPPAGRRAGPRSSTNARSDSLSSRSNPSPPTQSQSKLGIAAHFVPPETTFTPPKGADWDDVVLPTVARKTGITVSQNGHGLEHGHKYSQSTTLSLGSTQQQREDDLLAVEWDRDGTPIRWERQRVKEGLSEEDFAASRATAEAMQWNVDDFGAPAHSKSSGNEVTEDIEMAPIRNPSTAPLPVRPPRAAGRNSVHSSPQSVQQPFTLQPQTQQQVQQRPAQHTQQGQGQGYQQFPRPIEATTPTSLKIPRAGKYGRRRRDDDDDIKTGGCACVIM
ncbi:hypothetical protein CspeluHIS016_0505100 [Cutaneotrichosporon spelunceum]|uniref:Uncharacterized protein n=1 Tax=Cutaneotrichosporon spelunceum TaxID=1672016 RepID=A0AAD3YDV0_9TREE|nr:hypothetical protein CspeluHIS016_0505100 [Cutaneotrichosporon spelunceum]